MVNQAPESSSRGGDEMDTNHQLSGRGYYSILRYRSDSARGEFRNIAVAYVDESGGYSGMRSIRPGNMSRGVEEHGLLAGVIAAIEDRFKANSNGLRDLRQLKDTITNNLGL